jgi:hypothetical protein
MKPTPAICSGEDRNKEFIDNFLPSVDIFFATLFGLVVSLPVPRFLIFCFRKTPVLEKLTDGEKHRRIKAWRMWQTIGWAVAVPLHLFFIYWFAIFTNEFDDAVLSKLLRSSGLALFHRFVSAPAVRALMFSTILVFSKYGACCDTLLVMLPHILLPASLDRHDPGDLGLAFDADAQFDQDGVDVDFGAL